MTSELPAASIVQQPGKASAMAQSTREKLIRVADDLFYREGFVAVGLDRIINEVGVTKTTFYKHFESKDDLVLEVLRWHDRWWRDTFLAMLRERGGPSPRGQLASIFDALESLFTCGEYNGCIFVNVAVQFPLQHDPAHIVAAEHKRAMEEIIRELAGYAHASDPDALAAEVSLLMEGAYVTAQINGTADVCNAGRRVLNRILETYIPHSESGTPTAA